MINADELFNSAFEQRLLIFLEDGEVFNQIALSPEEFKKVSDLLASFWKKKIPAEELKQGYEVVEINIVDGVEIKKDVFENLNSIECD